MADLIITATLDAKDVEAKAQQIKADLAKTGVNNPNAGKALADNVGRASAASSAMLGAFSQMNGIIGEMARLLQRFSPLLATTSQSMRVLNQSGDGINSGGTGKTIANVTSNLAGGAVSGKMAASAMQDEIKLFNPSWDNSAPKVFENPFKEAAKATTEAAKAVNKFKLDISSAAAVIGVFAASFAIGGALYNAFTGLKNILEEVNASGKMAKWRSENQVSRALTLAKNDPAKQIKILEAERSKAENDIAAYSNYQGAKSQDTVSRNFNANTLYYLKRVAGQEAETPNIPSKKLAAEKLKSVMGVSKLKTDEIEAFNNERQQTITLINQQINDLKKLGEPSTAPTATSTDSHNRTKPGLNIITDDITRIGGSIGGGMDNQRAMANSLSSIDRAVAVIKSAVSGKSSQYI